MPIERVDESRRVSRPTGVVAAFTALSAAVALGIGATTPVRAGPNCTASCVTYPYTDVAAWVPRDYLWMYPALLTALGVVALTACLHRDAGTGRHPWGLVGFGFATVAASALGIDYVLQLAFVQPSLLAGETQGLSPLTIYNPHGVFLALEDLGYFLMGASLLLAGLTVPDRSRLGRITRWILVASGAAVIVAAVVLPLRYGRDLADHFEVIAIAVDWLALIVAGTLLALLSRRP